MFAGKPILGIAGGIGSGKSQVAAIFAELGAHVIDSDSQIRAAYEQPPVRRALVQWWGGDVLNSDGSVNRKAIAKHVFADPEQRRRLERLLHPLVHAARELEMNKLANDPKVLAFIWDAPLLFEAGLDWQCDAVVFVDSPLNLRQQRVKQSRGWSAEELALREKSQWPLDRKRDLSDYVVSNTADAGLLRDQVRELFPRILAEIVSAH